MEYPWITEAIIDWKINTCCNYKGDEIFCNKCELRGKICEKLSELAIIIADKIKEEDN